MGDMIKLNAKSYVHAVLRLNTQELKSGNARVKDCPLLSMEWVVCVLVPAPHLHVCILATPFTGYGVSLPCSSSSQCGEEHQIILFSNDAPCPHSLSIRVRVELRYLECMLFHKLFRLLRYSMWHNFPGLWRTTYQVHSFTPIVWEEDADFWKMKLGWG